MKNINILKWVLVLSIVIVLNLLFNVGTRLWYPEPQWENYCPRQQVNIQPDNQGDCVAQGGAWSESGGVPLKEPRAVVAPHAPNDAPRGYCDVNFTCQKEYDGARKLYNRNVFVVMVVLGLISIGVGFAVASTGAVSLGLSFGGLVALVIGAVRYWSDMQEYLRLIILALALAALIWLGIKKIRE